MRLHILSSEINMAKKTKNIRADGSLGLRVDLNPEIASILFNIMEDRRFQTYAEAIRYCIVETNDKAEFQLQPVYWDKVKKYMSYDHLKNKLQIFSVQNFINRALDDYFIKIESQIESLLSFDVRSELNEEELEIALAFLDCQEASFSQQVTTEEVAIKMNKRNVQGITSILDAFVEKGVLSKITSQSKIYYHAKPIVRYE